MVVRLLHMGAIDSINALDSEGNSALHFAAAHCEPEYVQVPLSLPSPLLLHLSLTASLS
jgi:ankyrin repeat protein